MAETNIYESPKLLGEYLLLHFGGATDLCHESLPIDPSITATPFPVRCVRELLDTALLSESASALEVGCAVGGSAFELARHCLTVEASDYSSSFIAAAKTLLLEGEITAPRAVEGAITTPFTAHFPSEIDKSCITFSVADATKLPPDLGPYDVVLAANLLCRLPDPEAFLSRASNFCSRLPSPGWRNILPATVGLGALIPITAVKRNSCAIFPETSDCIVGAICHS